MPHPTDPVVFFDRNTKLFKAIMKDPKTGQTWGVGHGDSRKKALYQARNAQPPDGTIRKAIGWVQRHPFMAGSMVGIYLAARHGAKNNYRPTSAEFTKAALWVGTLTWAAAKAFRLIKHSLTSYGRR